MSDSRPIAGAPAHAAPLPTRPIRLRPLPDGLARPGRWLSGASRDDGATTAEFAIVTMAAVGFAGLLVVILKSDAVRGILEGLVQRALTSAG